MQAAAGEQRPEVRGQGSDVRDQRPAIRGQRAEVGDQTSAPWHGDGMQIRSAKDLTVYRRACELAMRVFELSKRFPAEARFALTNQVRRSSRSICLNLREARAKRRYEAAFVAKLSDCDGENAETDSALDFALSCGCIARGDHAALTTLAAAIGKMLGTMIQQPQKFRDQRTEDSGQRSAIRDKAQRSARGGPPASYDRPLTSDR